MSEQLMVLVAGPYRGGTNDDPVLMSRVPLKSAPTMSRLKASSHALPDRERPARS